MDCVGQAGIYWPWAAIAERDGTGPAQKLVTLEIEAGDADASGFEPVWAGDKLAGLLLQAAMGIVCNARWRWRWSMQI